MKEYGLQKRRYGRYYDSKGPIELFNHRQRLNQNSGIAEE